MFEQRRILLLTYMVANAIHVTLAFNIDVTKPTLYEGEQQDFFGYKVLQFMSGTEKGIIVTAPLQQNGSGGVCKPDQSQTDHCLNPKEIVRANKTIPVKHFGLSMAKDSTDLQFTVCSPSVVHECNGNSYVNSVCFKISEGLKQISSFTPSFQDCTKRTVDLVFLFDGSESMTTEEFDKNKDFIEDIMDSLMNTSIKFAAVQFSKQLRKVFDFNDYQAGRALSLLTAEEHMKELTNTHKALQFVLDKILENPDSGSSPDAIKVVMLITDGDPSDKDKGVIKRYDEKNIIRFVIGVKIKDDLMDKIRLIASEPKDKNAFKIENYDGLTGVLENFQKKIFKMEGSKGALAGDMTNEMSQSGFSAVFHKDTLILGSVGTNSWRGSLQELQGQRETQIEDLNMQNDSYIGYSIAVGEKHEDSLYFTGAPRSQHKGQVVMFRRDGKNWTVAQRLHGDQIGSYFGAELCSVDYNSDGNTDFLLVGAPLFYQAHEKREGQIYVYALTDEMQLKSELNLTAAAMGRFGTTISSLADLNGDGLRDIAVGAPLEDDYRGAVYIYLGDRNRGIRATYSQRILGREILPALRFFGQAIDGNIDLGEDGLPDIAVGSQGTAVVLRSRAVFDAVARLSFQPKEISTERIDCLGNADESLPMVTLTACLKMIETTTSKAGAMSAGQNISYTLDLDPNRQTHRGLFSQTDRKSRRLTSTYEITKEDTCFNYSIYMPKCVKDTLSPFSIKMTIRQDDSRTANAVLNVDSQQHAVVEIPFEKKCLKNDICIAELEVDFNLMSAALLVAEDSYFNMSVTLSNHGDDSYNTGLTMHYPEGLSFSMMALTKASRPTVHICRDLQGVLNRTVCGVSHPVYRGRSSATFNASFHIMTDYEWDDAILLTVTGQSDNNNSTASSSLSKTIPVQFEIKMAVTVTEDSVTFLNFTTENVAPKKLTTLYKIDNLGWKAFPVNVSLFFPTKLQYDFEIKNYQVTVPQNKTQCTRVTHMESEYCRPEMHCVMITCDSFLLDKESAVEFILLGEVEFRNLKQHAANLPLLKRYTGDGAEVKFRSHMRVSYDEQKYVLDHYRKEHSEVRVEFIIPPDTMLIILTGVGVGLLLLIIIAVVMIKLGCFKRKTLEYYQEQEDEAAGQADSAPLAPINQSETADGKSEQPAEEKKLLDDSRVNGGIEPADTTDKGMD